MSLAVFDTEYCADSVEFSPFDPSLLFCATYQLDSDEDAAGHKIRKGRIYLLEVGSISNNDDDDIIPVSATISERQRIETPAILDSKW